MKSLIFFVAILCFSVVATYEITSSKCQSNKTVVLPNVDLVQTAYATGRNATYLHFLALECEKSHSKNNSTCDAMKSQVNQLDQKYHFDQNDK